jgi:hypothetical protein
MKASEFFPTTKGAFGIFDSVEIIRATPRESELQSRLDSTIDELEAMAIRVRARHERICKNCRKPYGEHTHALSMCPWPNPRCMKFQALTCSASSGSGENPVSCHEAVVPGSDFCAAHIER